MKKENRIRKNEEFSKIIAKKQSFSNSSFVFYIDNKKEENARVGISVSKKHGDAVVRNKIKRQVRMMFIDLFDFENYPYDIVCIIKLKYSEFNFEQNKISLEKLIKKAIIR